MKIKPTSVKDLNQIITAIPALWRKTNLKTRKHVQVERNIKIKSAFWQALGKHS